AHARLERRDQGGRSSRSRRVAPVARGGRAGARRRNARRAEGEGRPARARVVLAAFRHRAAAPGGAALPRVRQRPRRPPRLRGASGVTERAPIPRGEIAPSLLACNFARLEDEVVTVMDAGAKVIHVAVMDGQFVPPLTLASL